ncbi:MAG: 2-oxoacid:ferredoxin oxidoreductase subunit beta [Thermaerobacterales bacterium]
MAKVNVREKMREFAGEQSTWCPGCGDFAVLRAMQMAAVNLEIEPHDMVCVSGIGCAGKISQYLHTYGFHGVHGRGIPVATAVKLANRDRLVIAAGGDGDGYGLGLSHFMHAVRRNIDITYIVMDNHIYGLTTGQASPTSDLGHVTKTSPYGTVEAPIRPLETALAGGCGFVSQGFSGNIKHLTEIFERAFAHKGFSLVNVFSPCVTFNKLNTYDFYREKLVNIDEDPDYDRTNRMAAMQKVVDHYTLISGVIYEDDRAPYEEQLPNFEKNSLSGADLEISRDQFDKLLAQHM